MTMTRTDQKQCRDCGAWKPLDEFHSRGGGGRASECRPCATARVRAAQERRRQAIGDEAYRAERAAAVRRYRSDPEKRARNNAINRANHRALWRLAELHRDDFERLLSQERVVEGLEP